MLILPLTTLSLSAAVLATTSAKRGLVYIDNKSPSDDNIWTSSSLQWYYNYLYKPTPALANSKLQYAPMLWGKPQDNAIGEFYTIVRGLIDRGSNITHVLGFNEPDGPRKTGGSDISVSDAVKIWQKEMEPVRKLGVKLGAPATQGSPDGLKWLKDFVKRCGDGCTIDFLPIHWYGPFEGFASYVGQVREAFGDKEIWVTEFGYIHGTLNVTQQLYNQSTTFMDVQEDITRYSYFGSFRADKSNIGPAAAMLNKKGQLTDIGSWYLGGGKTGVIPEGSSIRSAPFYAWTMLIFSICIWLIT